MRVDRVRWILLLAFLASVLLAGCSGEDDAPPWVSEGQRSLYGDESIERDEGTARALRERARMSQADR